MASVTYVGLLLQPQNAPVSYYSGKMGQLSSIDLLGLTARARTNGGCHECKTPESHSIPFRHFSSRPRRRRRQNGEPECPTGPRLLGELSRNDQGKWHFARETDRQTDRHSIAPSPELLQSYEGLVLLRRSHLSSWLSAWMSKLVEVVAMTEVVAICCMTTENLFFSFSYVHCITSFTLGS